MAIGVRQGGEALRVEDVADDEAPAVDGDVDRSGFHHLLGDAEALRHEVGDDDRVRRGCEARILGREPAVGAEQGERPREGFGVVEADAAASDADAGGVALAIRHAELRRAEAHEIEVEHAGVHGATAHGVASAEGRFERVDLGRRERREVLAADDDALVSGAADRAFGLDDVGPHGREANHHEGHQDERSASESGADLAAVHVVEAEHECRQEYAGLVALRAGDMPLRTA